MSVSDSFGDSDDEALLFAATQVEAVNDFEESPRPAKRRRVDCRLQAPPSSTEAQINSEYLNRLSEDGSFGEDATNGDQVAEEDEEPKRPKRQLHAPKINANLDRVIVNQTQIAAPSQPWMIRGPIWKRPKPSNAQPYDATQELENLPSDAFSSSLATSPHNQNEAVIVLSSQSSLAANGRRRVAAPLNGLRQTTLFGRNGVAIPASQANKRHNWPLANKDEPPTHHQLDFEAMETWVYPTNIGKIRDYQFNIVQRGLFHNLLVALPTGLGKTFIAASIMLNFYRWTKDAQILFVAPTKPLVAQQVEACFNIAGIPRSQTTMLTGDVSPGLRADEWTAKRVFFMTPQTLINDLKTGLCDPKRVVLIVIDEAHKATGSYAYVEVVKFIRRFNESFRVLALTATPGGDVEAVQKVIDGLDISRCEIRTEQSLDIREYVHQKQISKQSFDPSEEMDLLCEFYAKAIQPVLNVVNGVNAYWVKDPLKLTPFGCTKALQQWSTSDAGRHASKPVKNMVYSVLSLLASIAQPLELLKYYSVRCFYDKLLNFRKETREGKSKSKYRKQIDESEPFERMMVRLKAWTSDPDFVGHPKLEQVRAEVLQHFVDAGEGANGGLRTATRVEIFSHFRDSVEEIYRVLAKDSPIVRPHVFVGQAAGKNSEGMSQKKQLEVTRKFKNGDYNVLISTSVGEEGLDIGEVDLIICYDSKSSPIRLLQRMGRTGRKRQGRVVWLQMKGKEQDDAVKAMDGYEKMQELIADGGHFTFHHDRSRRIVPREIQPVVDKRAVDIPVENTQRTPSDFLPVPSKRGERKKRPPKKFHMPDGVRTGFTSASRIDNDDEEEEEEEEETTDEAAPIPNLSDIFLPEKDMKELERRYQSTTGEDEDLLISRPRLNQFPERQRKLGPSKHVPHGRCTTALVETLNRMAGLDEYSVREQEAMFDKSALQPEDVGQTLVEDQQAKARSRKTKPTEAPGRRGRPPGSKNTKAKPNPASARKSKRVIADLSDMEAEPSSAPRSSPRMAVRSQAITLGSADTSGSEAEDADGYIDSDLEDFVVDDAEPLTQVASSLPSPSSTFKRPNKEMRPSQLNVIESSQELPEMGTLLASTAEKANRVRKALSPAGVEYREVSAKNVRKRRRIVSDDEDE